MASLVQIVVVAGTFRQFEDWCRSRGINPKFPRSAGVVYAAGEETLMGIAPNSVEVLYTGTPPSRAVLTANFLNRLGVIRRKVFDA